MGEVAPLPVHGTAFFDARQDGRTLRVSFHAAQSVFVLSMWRGDTCLGTFRLPAGDAPELVHAITEPLAEPYTHVSNESSAS
jgi:hypothetical protein